MKNIDKYRGCLVGGASGDALGYAVEFYQEDFIFKKYGENGITEYDLINEEIIYPAVKGQKKMQESKEKEGKNIILEEMGEKKPFLRLQECRNALTNVCKKGIL